MRMRAFCCFPTTHTHTHAHACTPSSILGPVSLCTFTMDSLLSAALPTSCSLSPFIPTTQAGAWTSFSS